MANSFSIWKDQILLHWDGYPPAGCLVPQVMLQAYPKQLLAYWHHIGPYTKYSETKGFFILSLSKQNLQRLKRQFGDISCNQGKFRIEGLKAANAEMAQAFARVQYIKNGNLDDIFYKMPPLAKYQEVGVNILTHCKKVPMFASCGLGKSYMSLVSTQEQFRRGILTPGKTLIVGKLATLFNGWLKDCEKFTHLKPVVLWLRSGTKRKEKLIELLNTPADIYIINHDGIRTLEAELIAKNFEKIIVDESTILKGYQGDRSQGGAFGKALMKVAHKAKWRVIMSGTPAPNGPQDLWGQMHFLDPEGLLLEKSIHDFRHTFMEQIFYGDPNNPSTPSSWIPSPDAADRIGALVNPLAYRVRIRDHLLDLPEKTIVLRTCKMSDEQSAHYAMMENTLMTEIDNELITASIKLAKLSKLRQITSGFLLDSSSEAHPIDDNPKLELMDQLINEEIDNEDKVVVYAQHRWEIEMLETRYKSLGVCTVYGNNASHVNLSNIDRFINDPSVRIIILHPKSAAHGVTFTVAHYMIFFSISYSEEDNHQCRARIERAGQKHPMFIYYLLCEDSIDTDIYEVLEAKQANQQALIDTDIVSKIKTRASLTPKKSKRAKHG
jgi:SNF2 family DNA or RNA helicase